MCGGDQNFVGRKQKPVLCRVGEYCTSVTELCRQRQQVLWKVTASRCDSIAEAGRRESVLRRLGDSRRESVLRRLGDSRHESTVQTGSRYE